ncbi:MAG TPA: Uma2 family endonuclease [Pseudomonadota bacterium]|nr:Uma2 family endonuclease [Pseudomonadota bacterium]
MAGASPQTPTPHLASLPDLLAIPEEQRMHEILDGEVVRKAMGSGQHGTSQLRAARLLAPFDRKPNGPARPGGWWFATEVEVELARHQVGRPDVAGWRRTAMPEPPHGYPLRRRPDWVCEVMADGDARRRDGLQKRRIYADHGVPHYWLIDTEREVLTVLRLEERGYVELLVAGRAERVRAEPFALLELQVGVLFGDDAD